MYLDDYLINEDDAKLFEDYAKSSDDEDIRTEIPITVIYGVTVTLCGLFMMFVPIPAMQVWGKDIMLLGAGYTSQCLAQIAQENYEREKKKNR